MKTDKARQQICEQDKPQAKAIEPEVISPAVSRILEINEGLEHLAREWEENLRKLERKSVN